MCVNRCTCCVVINHLNFHVRTYICTYMHTLDVHALAVEWKTSCISSTASAKFQLNTTAFMCYDWAFKSCKVQSGFPFRPALREWESVGIWLLMQLVFRSSARGPSGLMVRVSDYYSKSLEFESQQIVFPVDLIHTLSAKTSLFCPSNTLVVYI